MALVWLYQTKRLHMYFSYFVGPHSSGSVLAWCAQAPLELPTHSTTFMYSSRQPKRKACDDSLPPPLHQRRRDGASNDDEELTHRFNTLLNMRQSKKEDNAFATEARAAPTPLNPALRLACAFVAVARARYRSLTCLRRRTMTISSRL